MRSIQSPAAAQGLERQFKLRGRVGISLDEVAVPTRDLGDFLGRSPYEPDRWVGGDYQFVAAPGVGNYAGCAIVGAPGKITVVESLYLMSLTAVQEVQIMVYRPVDFAHANVTVTAAGQAVGRWNGRITPAGFVPQMAHTSTLFFTTNPNVPGGIVGRSVGVLNTDHPWQGLDVRPFVLDGLDPAGACALVAVNVTANQRLDVGWQASEYSE